MIYGYLESKRFINREGARFEIDSLKNFPTTEHMPKNEVSYTLLTPQTHLILRSLTYKQIKRLLREPMHLLAVEFS